MHTDRWQGAPLVSKEEAFSMNVIRQPKWEAHGVGDTVRTWLQGTIGASCFPSSCSANQVAEHRLLASMSTRQSLFAICGQATIRLASESCLSQACLALIADSFCFPFAYLKSHQTDTIWQFRHAPSVILHQTLCSRGIPPLTASRHHLVKPSL